MKKELEILSQELREMHGPSDSAEYAFLELLYQAVETSSNLEEAEDRLREMKRFTSSIWGYVHGRLRSQPT